MTCQPRCSPPEPPSLILGLKRWSSSGSSRGAKDEFADWASTIALRLAAVANLQDHRDNYVLDASHSRALEALCDAFFDKLAVKAVEV